MTAVRTILATLALTLAAAPAASACVQVGVYQDDPATQLPALQRKAAGVRWLSAYVTAGQPLNPRLVRLANARKVGLVVTWLPDAGRDGAKQPKHRLKLVGRGAQARSLRTLARSLARVRRGAVLRPMPEPNTPWYAWSGLANGNRPADYVAAWKRVRSAVRRGGGTKVKLLWSPYARSIPETGANAIRAYFPGASQVDLVGADSYNFGAAGGLAWSTPAELFADAYRTIQGLARKPFWIAETGSVARGGNRAAWIASIATLKPTMPKLAAVVWFDARDATGDFRLRDTATLKAIAALARKRCA